MASRPSDRVFDGADGAPRSFSDGAGAGLKGAGAALALLGVVGVVASIGPMMAAGAAAGDPAYTYADLGTLSLGGGPSFVNDVNDRNEIVGSGAPASGALHAFVWRRGTLTDLGATASSGASEALDVNNQGLVVGSADLAGGRHAVLWSSDNSLTDLGGDLSTARSVNDAGQVLLTVPGGALWQNGQRTPLGNVAAPTDLNEAGQVVGAGPGDAANDFLGSLWDDATGATTVIDLLPPTGGRLAVNLQVNEHAQVIGDQCLSNSGCRAGATSFYWENGVTSAVPTLGGTTSHAAAINNAGQVVGWAETAVPLPNSPSRVGHAFLWRPGTPMIDLGSLSPGGESYATDVNDAGQVVGVSGDRAFVWRDGAGMADVTPPATAAAEARFITDGGTILISALPDGATDRHWYLATPATDPGTTTTTAQPSTTTTAQPTTTTTQPTTTATTGYPTSTTRPATTTTNERDDDHRPVRRCAVAGMKRTPRPATCRPAHRPTHPGDG